MKKKYKEFIVSNKKQITPNMLRVSLVGKNLEDFNFNEIGGYVKLHFSSKINKKKFLRPYTLRDYREESSEIDIDFALHDNPRAIASNWARKTKIGDKILLTGPNSKQNLNHNADWFFFVGDMSAIPAISVNLESLPSKSKGFIILEIISKNDVQRLNAPTGLKIIWVVKHRDTKKDLLIEKVISTVWPTGKPFIWVACEFSKMAILRHYFKVQKKIQKEDIYISSYWKIGLNQEEHKIIKKKDSYSN